MAIVVSNMIGTGVFTTLGFQVEDIHNSISILLLWLGGGILALFGAFCYAELGTHFKGNGGDYIYLSRTFHSGFGYLYSWISLIIGFSSPVALAALAMARYLSVFGVQFGNLFAIVIIVLIGLALSFSLKTSGHFQNVFTLLKVGFIVALVILGVLLSGDPEVNSLDFSSTWKEEVMLPAFATSLIFVTYAYTGWNSASYLAGEIKKPKYSLPRALILGTIFVVISYLLINLIMLKHAPISEMAGKEDVMGVAAQYMLGSHLGRIINIFIALQLVATISGYLWVGSRITNVTAQENKLWSPLAVKNKNKIPVRALFTHVGIAVLIILTGSFKSIFIYTSFVLQLFATLAIATAFFLKREDRLIFKNHWFYIFPSVFVLFSLYILYFTFVHNPIESSIGLGIVGVGLILYVFDKRTISLEKKE